MSNVNIFKLRPSLSFRNKQVPIPFSGLFLEPNLDQAAERIFIYKIKEIDLKNANLEEKMGEHQLDELNNLLENLKAWKESSKN
jgi:hypothetical protein